LAQERRYFPKLSRTPSLAPHRRLKKMAYVTGAMPTLLTSRPVVSNEPMKQRRRPAPAALEVPEEPRLGVAPALDSP